MTMNGGGSGPSSGQPPSINCVVNGQTMTLSAYLDNIVRKWNQAGSPPSGACSMVNESVQTNQALTGTVTNKNIGDGDIAQTCDMKQTLTMSFTYSATVTPGSAPVASVTNFKNTQSGYQACAWAMECKAFRHSEQKVWRGFSVQYGNLVQRVLKCRSYCCAMAAKFRSHSSQRIARSFLRSRRCIDQYAVVGWAKRKRAHYPRISTIVTRGHATLCPPYLDLINA